MNLALLVQILTTLCGVLGLALGKPEAHTYIAASLICMAIVGLKGK